MRIACPHCQATYRVADIAPGTILVCHRCHTEFAVESPESEVSRPVASDEQLRLFGDRREASHPVRVAIQRTAAMSESTKTRTSEMSAQDENPSSEPVSPQPGAESADGSTAHPDPGSLAPTRRNARIWPWLITTLLLVAGSGFLVQGDAWLDNPWLRSTLINLGLPVEVRDKDWLVQPDSVQAQWLKRNDGSRVLVIEGRLTNQLSCELPLPRLVLDFYSDDAPDKIARTEVMKITLPPSNMKAIRQVPYKAPAIDDVPVAARSDRGFLLVLDSLPPRIADFTMGVQAVQP